MLSGVTIRPILPDDQAEAVEQGHSDAWEIAEYFGVPEEMVRVQPGLL